MSGASHQIHLIRHGKPACLPKSCLSREEFRQWVKAYDSAGILTDPPGSLREFMYGPDVRAVFSSSLRRSIQSAKALVTSDQISSDPLFNEAAICIAAIPFRMRSSAWVLLGRALWLLGGSATEDLAAGRSRARRAANLLMRSAISVDTVLVGHGWMNRMIGQELLGCGWKIVEPGAGV